MDEYVLGISAYYHDSAAALVRGGEIIAAAQEERFSRLKHDPRFPHRAINYCLGEAFIDPAQLAAVVFYDHPLLTFDRIVKNALSVAPRGRAAFVEAVRSFCGTKAQLADDIAAALGCQPRLLVTQHHAAHAASAFYPSPFERAAILTVDGVGEWATCSLGVGEGNRIELTEEIRYPHSLGLLYSAFTYYCGFKVNSGEYKLMGLAPYGTPKYAKLIRDRLIDVSLDGSFRLDTRYFGYLDSLVMTNERFDDLFGGPPRVPESPLTAREADLAASVQQVVEDVVLKLVARATRQAGVNNLVMAGGVALNCVANGRVWRESGLDGLFVQPAAGDAGCALGAALLVSHQLFDNPRTSNRKRDALGGGFLGPAFTSDEIVAYLDRHEIPFERVADDEQRARIVAAALAQGQVVGLLAGRMEFGPRALGARSILADPRQAAMQSTLNLRIKRREGFRPFAPAVLAERATEYFQHVGQSPYMLLVAPLQPERRLSMPHPPGNGCEMQTVLQQRRSDIPAVTHVDYSARLQTVTAENTPQLQAILRAFAAETGCPVLVNTSFNVRGEPIVCTPHDAFNCFMQTDIDLLVLEDVLVCKSAQPRRASATLDSRPAAPREAARSQALCAALFDEVLNPLASAMRHAGRPPYIPLGADAKSSSYFETPPVGAMRPGDFDFPGDGDAESLIVALAAYWTAAGQSELALIAPQLRDICQALRDEAGAGNQGVSIFCYAMF